MQAGNEGGFEDKKIGGGQEVHGNQEGHLELDLEVDTMGSN